MKRGRILPIVMAIVGIVFVWVPVLTAIGGVATGRGGGSLIGLWYIPAALAPVALAGAVLLLVAAWVSGERRALIGWTTGAPVAFWLLGALVAQVTGLASGATQEGGWESALVVAMYVAYGLTTVLLGVEGILLVRDLRAEKGDPAAAL